MTNIPSKNRPSPSISDSDQAHLSPQWLSIVRDRVHSLRFGTVQIVIHEGRVTQVDSTERTRFPASAHLSD